MPSGVGEVVLSWQVTGADSVRIDPGVGPVEGSEVTVTKRVLSDVALSDDAGGARKLELDKPGLIREFYEGGETDPIFVAINIPIEVEKAPEEAYKADATAKDLEEAANALGLSEADVEDCRNPG